MFHGPPTRSLFLNRVSVLNWLLCWSPAYSFSPLVLPSKRRLVLQLCRRITCTWFRITILYIFPLSAAVTFLCAVENRMKRKANKKITKKKEKNEEGVRESSTVCEYKIRKSNWMLSPYRRRDSRCDAAKSGVPFNLHILFGKSTVRRRNWEGSRNGNVYACIKRPFFSFDL